MPAQSECESSQIERVPRSNNSQRLDNSLDVAGRSLSPTHSGIVASWRIQGDLEYKQPQCPNPPKLIHLQSSPYFNDDSASYGGPLSDPRSPLGIQQFSVSAFDDIRSQSANIAASDSPRPLEPRTWGSAHESAPGASETPLVYRAQRTLQRPDDPALYSYAPDSTSASFELATHLQPTLPGQIYPNLPPPLGQIQTSFVDPSSIFLNPDPPFIDAQRHLRPAFADNGWQSACQRVPAVHGPQMRFNAISPNTATAPMPPALVHGLAFGLPNANPQEQFGPQPALAAVPTRFIPYAAPTDVGSDVGLPPKPIPQQESGFFPGN